MDDLTDLEICQKIAEIEELDFDVKTLFTGGPVGVWPRSGFKKAGMSVDSGSYNPLTDDALWANLILTHEVSINFQLCQISMVRGKHYHDSFKDLEDLRRKSLELIIAAHK